MLPSLPVSAACRPSDNALAVPLTLLTLAALTRAAHAPRIGAVLAFAMGLLALPIAISGAANLKLRWLSEMPLTFNPMLALVLLLPALPTGETGKGRGIVGIGILSITVSALIQGVLSYDIAVSLPDPAPVSKERNHRRALILRWFLSVCQKTINL